MKKKKKAKSKPKSVKDDVMCRGHGPKGSPVKMILPKNLCVICNEKERK